MLPIDLEVQIVLHSADLPFDLDYHLWHTYAQHHCRFLATLADWSGSNLTHLSATYSAFLDPYSVFLELQSLVLVCRNLVFSDPYLVVVAARNSVAAGPCLVALQDLYSGKQEKDYRHFVLAAKMVPPSSASAKNLVLTRSSSVVVALDHHLVKVML